MKKSTKPGNSLDYHKMDWEEVGELPKTPRRGARVSPEERERRRLIRAKRRLEKQTKHVKFNQRSRKRAIR